MAAEDIVVIIPARNEERSIGLVIRDIPRDGIAEIIVVDNGSTDRTAAVARAAGATVLSESRRGYGYACLAGMAHVTPSPRRVIVFLDGDYSDYPEELPLVAGPVLRGEADMVIGSRITGKRESGAMLPQALIGNRIACGLIKLFWGYRFTDLGPFRAVRMDALQHMQMNEPTFGWTVEMQIKGAKMKMRCTEVPVRYRRRIGQSKVTGTLTGTVMASVMILFSIAKHLVRKG